MQPDILDKIKIMEDNQLLRVVIFIRDDEIDECKESPNISDSSKIRRLQKNSRKKTLDELKGLIKKFSGSSYSSLFIKSHPLLGVLTAALPVRILRDLINEPRVNKIVEKIVEDVDINLVSTN